VHDSGARSSSVHVKLTASGGLVKKMVASVAFVEDAGPEMMSGLVGVDADPALGPPRTTHTSARTASLIFGVGINTGEIRGAGPRT